MICNICFLFIFFLLHAPRYSLTRWMFRYTTYYYSVLLTTLHIYYQFYFLRTIFMYIHIENNLYIHIHYSRATCLHNLFSFFLLWFQTQSLLRLTLFGYPPTYPIFLSRSVKCALRVVYLECCHHLLPPEIIFLKYTERFYHAFFLFVDLLLIRQWQI